MAAMSAKTEARVNSATELFIDGLKNGTSVFQRRWEPGEFQPPHNPISGVTYSGFNFVSLANSGKNDPRWVTYKQMLDKGWTLKDNMRSQPGIKWTDSYTATLKGEDGKPILDSDGNQQKELRIMANPKLGHFSVFNLTQIDGAPEIDRPNVEIQNDRAEQILELSGANIMHDQRDRAFCDRLNDEIHLPAIDSFESPEAYLATAMHELAHWSMHPKRLGEMLSIDKEDLSQPFGSEGYAREELRAEICSFMMNAELNIGFDNSRHQSYVNSWIKVLENDPDELRCASADASKIVTYVLELEKEQQLNKTNENEISIARVIVQEADFVDKLGDSIHEHGDFTVLSKDNEVLAESGGRRNGALDAFAVASGVFSESNGEAELFVKTPNGRILAVTSVAVPVNEYQPPNIERLKEQVLVSESSAGIQNAVSAIDDRTYLALPYREKDEAKAIAKENGIPLKWDKPNAAWYVEGGGDLSKLNKWLPNNSNSDIKEGLSPEKEFGAVLKDNGFVLKGDPIMDSKSHRVSVEGGKSGARDGWYVGFADGHPAGSFENHLTAVKSTWSASGSYVSSADKTIYSASNAQTRHDRNIKQESDYAERAQVLTKQLNALPLIASMGNDHQYLAKKGIEVGSDVRTNANKQLVVPIYGLTGNLQSVQYISEDGNKLFAAGARKKGGMYVFSKDESTQEVISGKSKTKDLFIVEGVATGHSVHEATGAPVIVAFDAHNLHSVAAHFKNAYPDTNIHICADNDRAKDVNAGREAAERVSESLDLSVILPRFKDGNGTDFNDLKNQEGKDAVMSQIRTGVSLYRQQKQGEVVRSTIKSGKDGRGNDISHKKGRDPRTINKSKEVGESARER